MQRVVAIGERQQTNGRHLSGCTVRGTGWSQHSIDYQLCPLVSKAHSVGRVHSRGQQLLSRERNVYG